MMVLAYNNAARYPKGFRDIAPYNSGGRRDKVTLWLW
jgi:hypothetical protein